MLNEHTAPVVQLPHWHVGRSNIHLQAQGRNTARLLSVRRSSNGSSHTQLAHASSMFIPAPHRAPA
jgi:hypothetical protein